MIVGCNHLCKREYQQRKAVCLPPPIVMITQQGTMRILTLLFLCLSLVSCASQQDKEKSHSLQERISRVENGLQPRLQVIGFDVPKYNVEERLKELGIPGVSVAVFKDGAIEWAKGYGMADSTEQRPVTTETLFQAGSISKAVAAIRALQLVEEGLLDLDADVNNYLTSWQLPDNEFTAKEKVTTRRILNHSAGLTIHGFPGYSKGDAIPSVPDILDGKGNTDSVRVFKEPGGRFKYSGGGYTIMQLMMADLEQRPFAEIMDEQVLRPLGMTSSTYENPLPKRYHQRAAAGYLSDGREVAGNWNIYPEMAAAGLWTTPSELVLWGKAVQQVQQSQEDGFLKVETVNEMLTPNEDDTGLGPYVVKHYYGHGGADQGFRAELMVWHELPIAVAVMSNSNQGSTIIWEVLLSLAEEYNLPGLTPRTREFKAQTPDALARFTGKYRFPESGDASIEIKEDGLEFSADLFSTGSVYLLPETDSIFFNKQSGTYYEFLWEDGAVTGVKFANQQAQKFE